MKSSHQAILPLIAWLVVWLAPVVALPIYVFAFMGAGWSVSGPHFPMSVLMLLGVAPFMAGLALLGILRFGKVTIPGIAALLIPALLSFAELGTIFLLWKIG
ncbi:MAG TPA: hypothetical protein VG077_06535 [Verrucomicrobiae bacterium]|nr:hypothetical protein [Verrucomicrobiae bacterium]